MVSTLLWRDLEKRGRWGVLINNASGLITPRGLCNCCTVSLFNSISHTAITSPCRVPVSLFFSLIYFMHNVYTLKMYKEQLPVYTKSRLLQTVMNEHRLYIYILLFTFTFTVYSCSNGDFLQDKDLSEM